MNTREVTQIPHSDYITEAFDDGRVAIDRIVIHSTVCTTQQAINTFSSPNATTSAHYIIGNDGSLHAGLEEYWVAYHAGNYPMNQRSIGIEHEWYQGIHPTDALYAKSAQLVKDICDFYGLPINSTTIIPHKQVVATGCPNEIDVAKIIALASGQPAATVDNCPAELAQVKAERDKLNTIIGTVKDPQIEQLKKDVIAAQATSSSCLAEKNSLSVQLQECQRQATVYKAEYDKAIGPTGYIEVIKQADLDKTALKTEITNLNTKLTKAQKQYETLKKPGLKFIQAAVIAICEKLGVQL